MSIFLHLRLSAKQNILVWLTLPNSAGHFLLLLRGLLPAGRDRRLGGVAHLGDR